MLAGLLPVTPASAETVEPVVAGAAIYHVSPEGDDADPDSSIHQGKRGLTLWGRFTPGGLFVLGSENVFRDKSFMKQ
ncbi:hypothetical protein [Paenibacillus sp.]|uniref:hypothetical protein n=1 Tax=Paenibacillus sp. TaxID=58172 RepID=UPI002810EA58|nr:hypothetical protein [Paenibacillus sp.]